MEQRLYEAHAGYDFASPARCVSQSVSQSYFPFPMTHISQSPFAQYHILSAVPSVTLRIGLEFGMPISQVEATRREVQTFLLLRSLFKQVYKLVSYDNFVSSPDDICQGMVNNI